jgi:tRNA(Ile)-lysidine synthase
MAGSEKPRSGKRVGSTVADRVAARLREVVKPGDRLLLGYSGGIDSMVLLHVLAQLAPSLHFELSGLHVNHQLSPHAADWACVCRAVCERLGVPCRVVKVEVARGNSLERAARDARYAAYAEARADYVVLAHNADDQAETVLLQLLRGGGVKGLAAMPLVGTARVRHESMAVRAAAPAARTEAPLTFRCLRPLLEVSRAEIERHAQREKLTWIEDESNADEGYLRNWLRLAVLPLITDRVPAYRATLTRAARHFGEAAVLLDELATIDAADAVDSGEIALAHLRQLGCVRAKNLVRFLVARRGWLMPDAERLEEGLRQALTARSDARVAVDLGDGELRLFHGTLRLIDKQPVPAAMSRVRWRGESELAIPELAGQLTMKPARGAGLSAARLASTIVTVRVREGGEKLQPAPRRPRRTVKNLLQEAKMPPWERARLPLIYCGDELACVPGVAIDYRYQALEDEASFIPMWETSTRFGDGRTELP